MRLPLLLSLSLLSACAPRVPPPQALETVAPADTIRRAPLDDREYRHVVLENGLKVLLVSDSDTDMAAAALDVHVGQFSDPAEREGLAHFLEHMLFLGTDAYPDVDAYRDFVQSHGGRTNAGTSQEHTRFHFEVDHNHLEGALDRFAAFFTSPRLDTEYVARERKAVHSEYRLKVQSQVRRFREVRRATSNPDHGFAQFSVGNLDTLADRPEDPIWDDLRAFYDREYSASRMALTVVGREDLDTLEGYVRARFAAVPTTGEPAPSSTVPIYLPHQLGARIHVTPLDEIRELYLEFPVPNELQHYRSHALDLLSSIVGQEGPGSLHQLLTERGWITRLVAGDDGAEDHSLFTLRIALTPEGLDHVDEIPPLLFQYMELATDPAVLQPYWEERKTLNQLNFSFAEAPTPASLARNSALALQLYPPEHVLDFWATWDAWDPELVATHVGSIRPDNMRMFVTAPDLPTDQVEPRYNVPWSLTPLDPALLQSWQEAPDVDGLALPPLNPYIPKDTALLDASADGAIPVAVVDEPGLRIWHLQDTSFQVPRAMVAATLHLPHKSVTLADKVQMMIWSRLVTHELASVVDQARAANIQPFLKRDPDGLYLEVRGYDDRLDDVMEALLRGITEYEIDPEVFEVYRQEMIRQYRNTDTERPIDQLGWALGEVLDPNDWNYTASANFLDTLTVEDLRAWRTDLFNQMFIELLVHGNRSADEAIHTGRLLRARFSKARPVDPNPVTIRSIPVGRGLFLDVPVNHADSAIRVLFQGDEATLEEQAVWLMLGTLMKTPAFTQLRTEQQLGYIVWAGHQRKDMVSGLTINIQSGVADPKELLARIDTFLTGFGTYLAELPTENYETVRAGIIANLQEAPTALHQKSRDLAGNLSVGVTTFDSKAQLVGLLEATDKAEVEALFQEAVLGDRARRLVLQATGHTHQPAEPVADTCGELDCILQKLDKDFVRNR